MLRANCFDKKLRIQFLAEQLQQGGEENKGKLSFFLHLIKLNRPCVLDTHHFQNCSGVCTTVCRHLPLLHRSVQVHSRREGTLGGAHILQSFLLGQQLYDVCKSEI